MSSLTAAECLNPSLKVPRLVCVQALRAPEAAPLQGRSLITDERQEAPPVRLAIELGGGDALLQQGQVVIITESVGEAFKRFRHGPRGNFATPGEQSEGQVQILSLFAQIVKRAVSGILFGAVECCASAAIDASERFIRAFAFLCASADVDALPGLAEQTLAAAHPPLAGGSVSARAQIINERRM